MTPTETASTQPQDLSIADLRALMNPTDTVAPEAKATPEATPAEEAKAEPATAPDEKPETPDEKQAEPERDEQGRFKAKDDEKSDDLVVESDSPAVKKRIGKAVAKQREAERRAAELAAEVERLRKERSGTPAETETKPAQDNDPKPTLDQFESVEEFTAKFVEWTLRQRDKQAESEKVAKTIDAKIAEAVAEFPDFENVAMAPEIQAMILKQPALGVAVSESPVFGKLAMYLGQNPAELAKLVDMTPTRALAELGKIEDRITAKTAAPKQSSAPLPKPPTVVTPSTASAAPKPEEMNVSELRQFMQAREAERNRF